MTIAALSELPELGVGMVHARGLEHLFGAGTVVEVEPQTSWHHHPPGEFTAPLDAFAQLAAGAGACLVHGVGDPFGSTIAAGPSFARAFAASVAALRPVWISEHLAFNRFGADDGVHATGFFMPPSQTRASAHAAATRIRELAHAMGTAVLFETGVSYLRPQPWELADGEYFAEVAEAADCGILLDLHNVWTNARNGRQPLDALFDAMPLDRVVELHVAGGVEHRGYWLDGHCGPTPAELRSIAERLVPRLGNLKAIVFELLPQFVDTVGTAAIHDELGWLERLWSRRGTDRAVQPKRRVGAPADPADAPSPAVWEQTLGGLLRGHIARDALARRLADDPAIGLYRELVARFRMGAIAEALPWTLRAIRRVDGPQGSHAALVEMLRGTTPEPFESTEALRFAEALARRPLAPLVRDALAIEHASLRALLDHRAQEIEVEHDPHALFEALAAGHAPRIGAPMRVTITP